MSRLLHRSDVSWAVQTPRILAFVSIWVLVGCHTAPVQNLTIGPGYQPSNVYRLSDLLPPGFRRVAVLPLSCDETHAETVAGRQSLEPVLKTELLKLKRFDLVWISPDDLERTTRQRSWEAEDKLPADFFSKLRESSGCDGVLFCRLSRFQPYPPLQIGWKMKLVDAKQPQTLWAVDEVFDSGEPLVSNAARRYELQHEKGGPVTDSPLILDSPQRFGHYTASAVLATITPHLGN